LFRLMGGGVDI